jgi:hypothetical protein
MKTLSLAEHYAAEIRNAAWMVRHYARHRRSPHRAAAILRMGLTVLEAFTKCDQYEVLLVAIVEGLKPQDYTPPF